MVIDFGNYRYISEDVQTTDQEYSGNLIKTSPYLQSLAYNSEKFNKLVKSRKYEEAADYASQYHFNDAKKQAELENNIETLRMKGRQVSAFYSKVDENDIDKVDFFQSVFENGGLEEIADNEYAKEYSNFKNQVGGVNSQSLSITFPNGWFDSYNNFDFFVEHSGLTEQELKANGIVPKINKGNTIIQFDKSNALANKILNNLPRSFYTSNSKYVQGLDIDGNVVEQDYDITRQSLNRMRNLVEQTQHINNYYEDEVKSFTKNYSSTIGGLLAPELEDLKQQRAKGELTPSQFNTAYKTKFNNILTTLQNIGSSSYEIYGNNGKDINDETLRLLSNEERAEAIRMISSDYDVTLKAMVSNGEIGTLVEIGALSEQPKNISDNAQYKDMTKSRRFQFFIPGLFTDLAQQQINRNTLTRSAQEINNMQDYFYDYKTINKETITPNGLGNFIYTKNNKSIEIGKDEAQRLINKDMAIKDGQKIKYQFINNYDYLVGFDNYNNLVKQYAFNVVNELYPDIALEDVDGNSLSIEDAFNLMSPSGITVNNVNRFYVNNSVSSKLEELYNIYNNIINSANYYINYNRIIN